MVKKNSYEVRGYDTLEDFEIGYQARHLIDVSNKKFAISIAKKSLKDFIIAAVIDDDCDTTIFSRNKYLTQYICKGISSFPKEELPLLMGIDPKLDGYIADQLKGD